MRKASLPIMLGFAFWCAHPAVQALGIGRAVSASSLGQPLNIVAAVQLDGEETLTPRCIDAAIVVGDASVRADKVRIAIEPVNDPRQRRIRITTTTPIAEPLVTVNLTVGCESRVTRSFVTLINPLVPNQVDPLELDAPPARVGAPAPAAAVAARSAATSRVVRDADARRTRTAAAVVPAAVVEQPLPTFAPHVAPLAPSAPTLRTRVAKTEPAVAPEAQTATATRRVEAALIGNTTARKAVKADPVLADTPSAHVRELEASLATLRSDSARGQQSVAALQARLNAVEDARAATPLLYVLAGFASVLASVTLVMWKVLPAYRRRPGSARSGESPRRVAKAAKAAAVAAARAEPPVLNDRADPAQDDVAALARLMEPVTEIVEERRAPLLDDTSLGGLEVTTVLDPALHARMRRSSRADGSSVPSTFGKLEDADARGHGPSMEDLIDVEQRADFYLVLGQDDAAIALLDEHVASGNGSPLPYLKLLEIHQRRRDEAAYNRVRGDFNERFKAYAPEWTEGLELGRSLEEYPATLENVQTAWDAPIRAMKMLDGLLFRRSANEDAFDFAAYRELLFLYSIARDLSGDVKPAMGANIDLVLPLDEESIALLSRRMKTSLPTVSANASRIGDADAAVDIDIFSASA